MKKYIVTVREVWCYDVEIEADSEKEALESVDLGQGNELEPARYETILDSSEWSVWEE